MAYKLGKLENKIELIPYLDNRRIVTEFMKYMMNKDRSINHQINNLKVIIYLYVL
jgi:hypothetical protein